MHNKIRICKLNKNKNKKMFIYDTYRSQRASEEKNVRFRLVSGIVLPTATLLDTKVSPFQLS